MSEVEQFGVVRQVCDPHAAQELADQFRPTGSPERIAEELDRVLQLDALFGWAWFNLGRAHLDLDNKQAGLVDYLAAALCLEGDAEAWVNALVLAVDESPDLAQDILTVAVRLVGPPFRTQLVGWTREQSASFPRDEFLRLIDEQLEQHAPVERGGFTLRLLHEDGDVEQFHLGRDDQKRPPA